MITFYQFLETIHILIKAKSTYKTLIFQQFKEMFLKSVYILFKIVFSRNRISFVLTQCCQIFYFIGDTEHLKFNQSSKSNSISSNVCDHPNSYKTEPFQNLKQICIYLVTIHDKYKAICDKLPRRLTLLRLAITNLILW